MAHVSGNPTWQDWPSTATPVDAEALEAIEAVLDGLVPPIAQARNAANQTIAAAGTWTAAALPTEDFDTDGVHDTSTNTGRFTYTRPGIYAVSALVTWAPQASTATPTRQARLVKSGNPIPGANNSDAYAVGGSYFVQAIPTTLVAVNASQYIELQVATALAGVALFGAADAGCLLTSRFVRAL